MKWFCSAYMKSFLNEARQEHETFPQRHPRRATEELAPVLDKNG
jgi:hypothetical protein